LNEREEKEKAPATSPPFPSPEIVPKPNRGIAENRRVQRQ